MSAAVVTAILGILSALAPVLATLWLNRIANQKDPSEKSKAFTHELDKEIIQRNTEAANSRLDSMSDRLRSLPSNRLGKGD